MPRKLKIDNQGSLKIYQVVAKRLDHLRSWHKQLQLFRKCLNGTKRDRQVEIMILKNNLDIKKTRDSAKRLQKLLAAIQDRNSKIVELGALHLELWNKK